MKKRGPYFKDTSGLLTSKGFIWAHLRKESPHQYMLLIYLNVIGLCDQSCTHVPCRAAVILLYMYSHLIVLNMNC